MVRSPVTKHAMKGRTWLSRPRPTQRRPNEDAVEWARKETWAFTLWKCKVYGLLLGVNVVLIALICKGMPLHNFWRWAGLPLALAFGWTFSAFGFYAASAIGELFDHPRK